ncbi:hypothetical protein V5O48_018756 [Marasmius crinis-equi]|uniref:F-box domain-containing protein n=1 Tax=Marasmius crinis-equi TaxID=585013 RepID=A0ABR3EKA1_9AGAR
MNLETPFARVLDTNYIPSVEERDTLQSLIREPEEMILELDEEIARLVAKREELRCFVGRHRTLLSPFRRLPVDVWRTIFCACLPDNKLSLCTRTMKEAPLLLTTVCRSWREIALNTPRLWHSIHIFIPLPSGQFTGDKYVSVMRARIDGFREWLDRSGSLPITISLAMQGHLSSTANQDQSASALHIARTGFTELVAQYSHRWGTLVFGFATETLDLSPFDRLTPQDLRLLEDVHGFGTLFFRHMRPAVSDPGSANLSPLAHLLSRASSLRRLKLINESIIQTTLSLPLAWSRLTELSISLASRNSLTPGQVIRALAKQCRSLITFSLENEWRIRHTDHDIDVNSSPFEWPSLQDLSLSFRCPCFTSNPDGSSTLLPVIANTFMAVVFTSLTRFSVCIEDRSHNPSQALMDTAPFEALLLSSQRSLVSLEVSCPQYFTLEALLRVLRPLNALTSLNLGHTTASLGRVMHEGDAPSDRAYYWCSMLLQAIDSDYENVCPGLEEVGFWRCYVNEVDALLRFAVQRPKLRAFRVDFGQAASRFSLESRAEMEVLRERGVGMSWSYMEVVKDQPHDNPKNGIPWWSLGLVGENRQSTGRTSVVRSHVLHA